jgi:hypothetical protein
MMADMRIIRHVIFSLTFLLVASCGQPNKTFNKDGWLKIGDFGSYPERASMVDDLLKNHKLKGLTYDELINKLGQPTNSDSTSIHYDIEIEYGIDIDPTRGSSLVFYFNRDSIITDIKLNDWSR